MSLVFLFPLFTEGQMDYKFVFNTTNTSYHSDHQIDRQKRNQPYMKVFGIEK